MKQVTPKTDKEPAPGGFSDPPEVTPASPKDFEAFSQQVATKVDTEAQALMERKTRWKR